MHFRHENIQTHTIVYPTTDRIFSYLHKRRKCSDGNPKVVRRIFLEDGKPREYFLCKNHRLDLDFDGYISEMELKKND